LKSKKKVWSSSFFIFRQLFVIIRSSEGRLVAETVDHGREYATSPRTSCFLATPKSPALKQEASFCSHVVENHNEKDFNSTDCLCDDKWFSGQGCYLTSSSMAPHVRRITSEIGVL
jgi:hypothetical protein